MIKNITAYIAADIYSRVKCKKKCLIPLQGLICLFLINACQNSATNDASADLVQTNFINRATIYLLGRKPYPREVQQAKSFFANNGFSRPARREYLLKVSAGSEYKLYLYQLARNDLMNFIFNPDSSQIQNTIDVWTRLYPNDYGRKEIARLKTLQTIPRDLLAGRLDNIGLQKRLVHNSYYDFINMGTENFVISMYNNFLDRSPTHYELAEGKKMVDSSDGVLWGEHGHSKEDFVALFFTSYPYFEGQVRMLYKRYYFSEPPAEYLAYMTLAYHKNRDLRALQAELLSRDEFIAS